MCESHQSRFGQIVEPNGHHCLSCKFCAGRLPRHARINKIISQGLKTAGFPNILEPTGINRRNGKRPDGATIIPWFRGKSLLCDSTVGDAVAHSYLHSSSRAPMAPSQSRSKEENIRNIWNDEKNS